ncbi:MAG: UDP-3-O-acyl-N-acetylglucosamine deacetylase [Proteobacteria bacterium]|nr:UDP-3-O-acyl-N-acetylglucosamine deacetylase [Pseudomonadota bacterium]
MALRRTLAASFTREGIGAHGGETCRIEARPAAWGAGIVFETEEETIRLGPATLEVGDCAAVFGELSEVAAPEALLAALVAVGVTDVTLKVEGQELPALDGTAGAWLTAIDEVGLSEGPAVAPRVIAEPAVVTSDDGYAALVPGDACEVAVRLDAGEGCTGEGLLPLDEDLFRTELAWARPVALDLVERQAQGGWIGTHEGNAVTTAEALKTPDEGVRRAMLEALGLLAALGPVQGRLEWVGGGAELCAALFRSVDG